MRMPAVPSIWALSAALCAGADRSDWSHWPDRGDRSNRSHRGDRSNRYHGADRSDRSDRPGGRPDGTNRSDCSVNICTTRKLP